MKADQLDLFAWAESKPSNIIDAIPALCRKAAFEVVYRIPKPKDCGEIVAAQFPRERGAA